MTNETTGGREAFIIPARTLQGSKQEMLDDIDQAIVGLLALRHLIDDTAPPPERLAGLGARIGRRHSVWSRLLAAALPAAFGG
jgi:hypothetical protein